MRPSMRKPTVEPKAVTVGLRRHHRHTCSTRTTRRARIGRSLRKRDRSSANSSALAYRREASFSIALRTMVSRSRGMLILIALSRFGSCCTTWRFFQRNHIYTISHLRINKNIAVFSCNLFHQINYPAAELTGYVRRWEC